MSRHIPNFNTVLRAPLTQATTLTFSEVSDTQLRLTWVRGDGREVLIVVKTTASVTTRPSFNTSYTANSVFGSGSQIGTGNYVVFKGTGTTVLITGLTTSTGYTFYAYEFNFASLGTEKYLIDASSGNPASQTTLPPQIAPTTQATNLIFLGDRTLDCTAGNGVSRLWLYNISGAINGSFLPVDNTTYVEGDVLGGGNTVGGLGAFTRFVHIGLPYATTIAHRVFEYNIASGNPKYNLSTSTNNPITAGTPAVETYYRYLDTPFLTRRNAYNLSALGSREISQLYPTCDYIGSTHHQVFFVAEGDNTMGRLSGIDRTIRYSRALADDPTVKTNWIPDSPVDAWGDTPSFLDSSCLQYDEWSIATTYADGDRVRRTVGATMRVWESLINGNLGNAPAEDSNWTEIVMWDGNQCWMMSAFDHTHLSVNYQIGVYVANRFIANRYGVGIIVSTDEFQTYTRYELPIIAETGTVAAYYVHVTPQKLSDGFWYLFMQNYIPSFLTEDHLYSGEIWRTANDPNPLTGQWTGFTKITGTTDIWSGRGYGGAVDMSTPWVDGTNLDFYFSPNDEGQDGKLHTNYEGSSNIFTTFPVGNKILHGRCPITNLSTFRTSHYVMREVYRTEAAFDNEVRAFCPRRSFGGNDFFVGMGFLYREQTLLVTQNEPKNTGWIVSRDLNTTGAIQVRTEIYPDYCRVYKPHQSRLDDNIGGTPVQPFNPIDDIAGTVVGSPKIAKVDCIQPVSGGYVTFNQAQGVIFDDTNFALRVLIDDNNSTASFGVCKLNGVTIRHISQFTAEAIIRGSDGNIKKHYRFNISNNKSFTDSTPLIAIGVIIQSGIVRCTVDWNLNITPTLVVDLPLTTIQITDNVLYIGDDGTGSFSPFVVGDVQLFTGANVTDEHYLYHNIIGY